MNCKNQTEESKYIVANVGGSSVSSNPDKDENIARSYIPFHDITKAESPAQAKEFQEYNSEQLGHWPAKNNCTEVRMATDEEIATYGAWLNPPLKLSGVEEYKEGFKNIYVSDPRRNMLDGGAIGFFRVEV